MKHPDVLRDFCIYCGNVQNMVWVHSHFHCTQCRNNAIPSCEGDEIDASAVPKKVRMLKGMKAPETVLEAGVS